MLVKPVLGTKTVRLKALKRDLILLRGVNGRSVDAAIAVITI